jgi:hypothetical protein
METLERIPATAVVTTLPALLELAVRQGSPIDTIERLLAASERWEKNEARKAFSEAMVLFKSRPLDIRKNKSVGYATKAGGRTSYRHATLDEVCDKIIARLSECGISHRWVPEQKGNIIKITCVLTHRLGHSESTSLEGPNDDSGGKNAIQAVGSSTTYLERYTLLAVTGLAVKDQDDDGVGASARKADPEAVYRVEPRTVVDQPTARTETAPRRETGHSVEDTPERAVPAQARPLTEGQRKIIVAKLKNAGLTDTDVQAKFGMSLNDERWIADDFNTVAAWIASRR